MSRPLACRFWYNRDLLNERFTFSDAQAFADEAYTLSTSRIMVAVSSPWASEKIYETVRDLARRLDATVVVTHVTQPQADDESPEDMRQRAEQTLSTLTNMLLDSQIAAESVMLFGDDIARALINAASAQNITLLVLGATGKGRVARLLAGDIPQQVINNIDIPILTFPPDWSGTV